MSIWYDCEDYPTPVENLDTEKFSGKWLVDYWPDSMMWDWAECVWGDWDYEGDETWKVQFGSRYNYIYDATTIMSSPRMTFTHDVDGDIMFEYDDQEGPVSTIIATDYDTYALSYQCATMMDDWVTMTMVQIYRREDATISSA